MAAKIVRYNGDLAAFASAAPGTERTIFGDVAQANDLTSQINADFLRGWGNVGPSDQPALEDFNGAMYTHGQLLAYLHQIGVAEYNATQEYHIGSLCNVSGTLYSSIINNNIGNTPVSSPASWGLVGAGRLLNTQRFIASGTYTPTTGTRYSVVRILSGGGAGGGAQGTLAGQQSVGGGGGSGGYSEGIILNPTVTAITVGAGGAPGAAGLVAGGNGGTSSYGGIIAVTGGTGGAGGSATSTFPMITAAGIGGTGAGASIINSKGSAGGVGLNIAIANVASGRGGSSVLGGGGQEAGGTQNGEASSTIGAGGSGGVCFGSIAGGRAGGAGGAGILIIEEYS